MKNLKKKIRNVLIIAFLTNENLYQRGCVIFESKKISQMFSKS